MGKDGSDGKKAASTKMKVGRKLSRSQREELAGQLLALNDKGAGSPGGNGKTWLEKYRILLDQGGVELPAVEVSYRLTVTTQALVGAAALPSVISPLVFVTKKLLCMGRGRDEKPLKLLDDVRGVLKPGRLTLLLGPPTSGKSTLLKALAGRLHVDSNTEVEGEVWFNGLPSSQFNHARTSAFVGQLDNHEGNLTVQETLDFAYNCQMGPCGGASTHLPKQLAASSGLNGDNGSPPSDVEGGVGRSGWLGSASNLDMKSLQVLEELMHKAWGTGTRVEIVEKLFGLAHCADTLVGNDMVRGLSGGEKKRLSTAEQIVGPRNVLMMDEISTGLDSATLFTTILWLGTYAHAMSATILVSLLQPPPEVFDLFDDVIIFGPGTVLYHGPVKEAVPFFSSLGFVCPPRKDVPSYLLELTTAQGQAAYHTSTRVEHEEGGDSEDDDLRVQGVRDFVVPLKAVADAFWESTHGQAMNAILGPAGSAPALPASNHPKALVSSDASYALNPMQAIIAATQRQMTLVLRDRVLLKGRIIQVIVVTLITSSLFYFMETTVAGARTYFGLSFLSVLFINFGSFPQLPITLEGKKVWYKHRSNHFIPAYAYGIAQALAQVPLSVAEATVFSIIMYFMVDLYRSAGYFFTYWVVLLATSFVASAIFRFTGCVSPNMVAANAGAGLVLVVLVVTSGFAIVRTDIPDWMIWAYWVSPFSWALRGLAINELTSPRWQALPYPNDPTKTLGEGALESFAFFTDRFWIWAGVGYLFGLYILLTIVSIMALAWLQPEHAQASVADEEVVRVAREHAQKRRSLIAKQRERAAEEAISRKPSLNRMISRARSGIPANLALDIDIDITSSLPFEPCTLVWKDIRYNVPNPAFSRKAARAWAAQTKTAARTSIDAVSVARLSAPSVPAAGAAANGGTHTAVSVDAPAHSHAQSLPGAVELMPDTPPKVPATGASQIVGEAPAGIPGAVVAGLGSTAGRSSVGSQAGKAAAPPRPPLEAQERLQLLQGITGYAEPGVLTALMGGSGAGKTTLMDVLLGRKTVGEISGDIMVNGFPKDQASWSRVVGYCEQFDVHSPLQTVHEALMTSARLRLPESVTDKQVWEYVEEVMDIVDLMDVMDALVGSPGVSGLSVEARKRLTIAVELVANPSVVFMDEPTSGLDARAAVIVMTAVRNVARSGRTVMVTIHQPSIEIFESFDQLLLIQRGGRTSYFGPLGKNSSQLISYLTSTVPGTPPVAPGYNPATWMLEVTGGSMATLVQAVQADWPALYSASQHCADALGHANALIEEGKEINAPLTMTSQYAQPFSVQFRVLLSKYWLAYWRNPGYNFVRIAMTFGASWIYAAVYYDQGQVSEAGGSIASVQAVLGVMYASTNFLGMTNLMSVMPMVGYERVVFYRERAASMYNPFAFGLVLSVVEIPYLLMQTLIFMPIVYWMVGFIPDAGKFFYYLLMFLETIFFYNIFGQFLVFMTPAQAMAQVMGGALNFLFNIFNGFVITYNDIPKGWRWFNRITPTTWIMYGLGVSQLGDSNVLINYNGRMTTVSEFMENRFGYQRYMQWWCALIVFAFIAFMRVTSILALRYVNFLRR